MRDRYPYGSNSMWDRDDEFSRDDLFDNDRNQRDRYPEHYGNRGAYHDVADRYDMARYDYGREYDAGSEHDDRSAERGYRGDTAGDYNRTHHQGVTGRHFGYGNPRPYGAAYAGADRYGFNHDFGGDNPHERDYSYGRRPATGYGSGNYASRYSGGGYERSRYDAPYDRPRSSSEYDRDRHSSPYDRDRDYRDRPEGGGLGSRIRRGFQKMRHDMGNWEHRPVVGRDEEIDSRRGYVRDKDHRMTASGPAEWDRSGDWRWRR